MTDRNLTFVSRESLLKALLRKLVISELSVKGALYQAAQMIKLLLLYLSEMNAVSMLGHSLYSSCECEAYLLTAPQTASIF